MSITYSSQEEIIEFLRTVELEKPFLAGDSTLAVVVANETRRYVYSRLDRICGGSFESQDTRDERTFRL